ncbi:MAG: helix-turn-helix domain-containing protein, partial [Pseudomonadales bacterium]
MKTSESSVHSLGGIVAFILGNLDEALTVDNLSQRCLLSEYHFHRQFRAYIGVNVERFVQLVRLKRASLQLVFNRQRRVTDVAVDAGFDFPESFTRAFRREYGQSPTQFMCKPDWQTWWKAHHENKIHVKKEFNAMQVDIIDFPETLVAALE